jgi:hypothetical protein
MLRQLSFSEGAIMRKPIVFLSAVALALFAYGQSDKEASPVAPSTLPTDERSYKSTNIVLHMEAAAALSAPGAALLRP